MSPRHSALPTWEGPTSRLCDADTAPERWLLVYARDDNGEFVLLVRPGKDLPDYDGFHVESIDGFDSEKAATMAYYSVAPALKRKTTRRGRRPPT